MFRCVASLLLAAALATPAAAQFLVQRTFPQTAFRGELTFGVAPNVVLNPGKAGTKKVQKRLTPGSKIFGTNNVTVTPGELINRKLIVNYRVDQTGDIAEVWILRTDEIPVLWPRTPQEASELVFDAANHRWLQRR